MPQFGESITEALIVRWLKKEGEAVAEKEPLVELETEKSVFSYESPFQGRLVKILGVENQQITVGTEIAHFEIEDGRGQKYLSLGIGKLIGAVKKDSTAPVAAPKPMERKEPPRPASSSKAIPPLIRSLAKEKGIPLDELEKISGTGPEGRLTKEDFSRYLETRQPGSTTEGGREIPLTPIRARIAEKMTLSKQTIPHAGTGVDVDVTGIEAWRAKNPSKFGALYFVLFTVIPALKKFPVLNSSFKQKEGRQWIEQFSHVNLGVATSTTLGLMVPVIKNADRLSFTELVGRATELIEKARSGRLDVAELTGGTFTVNNTGALGAIRSAQIIPPPQAGILAVNRSTKRPWVAGNQIEVRSILSLDLAFDHRLVDGDAACGFLEEVRHRLENFDFTVIR